MRLKTLGLAAIAAMAAMAFIGAGSASATTLCKANENPCAAGNQYPGGTEVKAELLSGTTAKLVTDLATVNCTVSKSEGKTNETSGEPLAGLITGLTFTSCKTTAGVSCTVTVINLPYAAALSATGGGNGIFSATSDGSGDPGATVVCGLVLNCTFTTPEASLTAIGGAPGELRAEEVELERKGVTCPATSTWTASYVITSPTSGWVVESP